MEIRRAEPRDAEAICEVVRRSIIELCVDDHRNDPHILSLWLANKTPENVAQWITNPENELLVASRQGMILSAGCVRNHREITLNYISPDGRFQGVSRAMLAALEQLISSRGHGRCVLDSTTTAYRFYLDAGYVANGAPIEKFGMLSYPMMKAL